MSSKASFSNDKTLKNIHKSKKISNRDTTNKTNNKEKLVVFEENNDKNSQIKIKKSHCYSLLRIEANTPLSIRRNNILNENPESLEIEDLDLQQIKMVLLDSSIKNSPENEAILSISVSEIWKYFE